MAINLLKAGLYAVFKPSINTKLEDFANSIKRNVSSRSLLNGNSVNTCFLACSAFSIYAPRLDKGILIYTASTSSSNFSDEQNCSKSLNWYDL